MAEGEWASDRSADLAQECPGCGERFIITVTSFGEASAGFQPDGRDQRAVRHDASSISAEPRADPLEIGENAPDFELPAIGDDGITTYRLSDYLDTGAVVLLFYPFTFSPVCTTQLCQLHDADWLTVGEGIDVFGISVDSVYAQRRFREEYDLQFPLVTDRLARIADEYGVRYEEWEGHPSVAKRAVFAIDESRTIRYNWVAEDANESPSLDDLTESIAWL